MRSYSAIYVDVGYLIAAAATRVTGTSLRSGVKIDYRALIGGLIDQVERASGLPTLRVNWYDSAARGVPDEEQRRIAMLPRVKVRLGRLSYAGEQKGVDLRIGLDLATQGRRRVVDVAYLVSGDDDLTEAVEEAQSHGVQVVLLAVPGVDGQPHGVAQHLMIEADGVVLIDEATMNVAVHKVTAAPRAAEPIPAAPAHPVPSPAQVARRRPETVPAPVHREPVARSNLAYSTSTDRGAGDEAAVPVGEQTRDLIAQVCKGVVDTWTRTAEPGVRERIIKGRPNIPPDLDRALLVDLSDRLGVYDIAEVTRHALRDQFWNEVDAAAHG